MAAFRNKFGRSFDASSVGGTAGAAGATPAAGSVEAEAKADAAAAATEKEAAAAQAEVEAEEEEDYLLDLISTFGQEQDPQLKGGKSEGKKRK